MSLLQLDSVNPVRTLSVTKAAFFSAYSRPIAAIYRRIVEEILVELHLVTVNVAFVYDPFFALGLVTVYDALMDAYQPQDQRDPIFGALCQALQMKPEVLRQDAKTLVELIKSGDPPQRLKLLQQQADAEDVGGLRAILGRMNDAKTYEYSRILAVGLYTSYELLATSLYPDLAERTQKFIDTVIEPTSFSGERAKRDLELYRGSLDKMKQARAVMEEMVKAARRQQERRTAPTEMKPDSTSNPAST
ncbi:MAG: photosystem II biogenesis protein Psp29 [Synechococcaceae cyanobacterium SM2_3_2]|nr:photosystem II biogenesis protein Psp29 [Synechococcaceae cyanobacterium SM2_3_2]